MNRQMRNQRSEVKDIYSYWERSRWPLQGLFFLLPMIVFYEIGTLWFTSRYGSEMRSLTAEVVLEKFFNLCGVTGYYLPGLIVMVVLLCWHVVRRDPWRVEPKLYLAMFFESVAFAIPLLVFGMALYRGPVAQQAVVGVTQTSGFQPLFEGLILSIGAGLYEELVFRLIAIALLHMVLVDLLALPPYWGAIGSVVLSSMAFAYVHFSPQLPFTWGMFAFYTMAGIYFAGIYVLRGFGVVAAAHAIYDIIAISAPFLYRAPA